MRLLQIVLPMAAVAILAGCSMQQKSRALSFEEVTREYPAGQTVGRLFPSTPAPLPAEFEPTGLTKKDYLALIAPNVDFWKQHQSGDGAILDPYDKSQEKQYATPAFALACAILVKEAGRDDLLNPSVRAFSFSLSALVHRTTADEHADFYIPMLMHAHRILKSRVPKETQAKWKEQFKSIVPEKNYQFTSGEGNWNIVHVAGEAMRRKDKLVASTKRSKQTKYIDACLKKQQNAFTTFGMYEDANQPLAYDAFPRMWLEDMLADRADERGPNRAALERTLTLGGFSSLLLTSPVGEAASGGRSAQHQWNEAQNAVIGEINAIRWQARGRPDIAGAFKRMARLGLTSMQRWQRPSGELWIVKNRAEPAARHGFEIYSYPSQYNLLAMAMLAIAYERADDTIDERPLPAEFGSYVFDLREKYHKVAAASGGYYVLIDTGADAHYDASGLIRVHRRSVELSPLSDSSAGERVYGPIDAPRGALAPGVQWKEPDGTWVGLADYHRYEHPPKPAPATWQSTQPATTSTSKPAPPATQRVVARVELSDVSQDGRFTLRYDLNEVRPRLIWPEDPKDVELYTLVLNTHRVVVEEYALSAEGVRCSQRLEGGEMPQRWVFPVLVTDGAKDTKVTLGAGTIRVVRAGGEMNVDVVSPSTLKLEWMGDKLPTHNGWVHPAGGHLRRAGEAVQWKLQLK